MGQLWINKDVVRGTAIPNYSNSLQGTISVNNIYYVYAYLRSKDSETAKAGTPYYIGKGCGHRAFVKHDKLPVPQDKSNIIFCETNLTNVGALALERRLIRWYGRKDLGTGILRNKTDGGEDGPRMVGSLNPMFGKTHSIDAIEKIKARHTGRKNTEETRLKCKLAHKHTGPNYKLRGKNNAMYIPGIKEKRADIFMEKYGVTGPTLVPYKCEYCEKEGTGLGNYKRWHGNNCKSLNPINT